MSALELPELAGAQMSAVARAVRSSERIRAHLDANPQIPSFQVERGVLEAVASLLAELGANAGPVDGLPAAPRSDNSYTFDPRKPNDLPGAPRNWQAPCPHCGVGQLQMHQPGCPKLPPPGTDPRGW